MKPLALSCAVVLLAVASCVALPQVTFGDSDESSDSGDDGDVGLRLGLIASNLGLDPLATTNTNGNSNSGGNPGSSFTNSNSGNSFNNNNGGGNSFNNNNGGSFNNGGSSGQTTGSQQQQQSSNFQQQQGRQPFNQERCCCISSFQNCPAGGDSDFSEFGRGKGSNDNSDIGIRIANVPSNRPEPLKTCPANSKLCCADSSLLPANCPTPTDPNAGLWRQGCRANEPGSAKPCGTRQFNEIPGLQFGQASPGEFPWTCLLLGEDNNFIGTCVIIPNDSSNNNFGTRKVLTVAHRLKLEKQDLLKVRVGEYDASGFNEPERIRHQEYTVVRIQAHENFNSKRLTNDIALLTVDRDIDLSADNVNTACLPSCDNQFDFQYANGTGTRCWVAGWGKDAANGQFQFIQRKVDVPLVNAGVCEARMKTALNRQKAGAGDRFRLDASELCAGAEVGKDACQGDGGSPLVCQSASGRWTVVGLVAWGVQCATDLPGIYAKVSHFTNWINVN